MMTIPARLNLQPASIQFLDETVALCDAIEQVLEAGESAEALLHQSHSHTWRRYTARDFQTYWEAADTETFALEALNPQSTFDEEVVYAEALPVLDIVVNTANSEAELSY